MLDPLIILAVDCLVYPAMFYRLPAVVNSKTIP
jgi:hypothetical protein